MNLLSENTIRSPLTSGAGAIGAYPWINDGIGRVSQNVADIGGWISIAVGVAVIVMGFFGRDPGK